MEGIMIDSLTFSFSTLLLSLLFRMRSEIKPGGLIFHF
jgi:hypothetical protein